jgi:5-methylcytosine-specific restriction endonuclease McrA
MYVFERASGRCENCGLPAGQVKLGDSGWRVAGAHVHHIIPIAARGRHQLTNLRLLCVSCHRAAHPDNPRLGS